MDLPSFTAARSPSFTQRISAHVLRKVATRLVLNAWLFADINAFGSAPHSLWVPSVPDVLTSVLARGVLCRVLLAVAAAGRQTTVRAGRPPATGGAAGLLQGVANVPLGCHRGALTAGVDENILASGELFSTMKFVVPGLSSGAGVS